MPLLPAELAQPFQNQHERAAARHRFVERDHTLTAIESLARRPASDWTTSQHAAFPGFTNGITDPPPRRVARWASLFAEELAEVHQIIANPRPLADLELQEALYLTGRLLATVTGLPINRVDSFRLPLHR